MVKSGGRLREGCYRSRFWTAFLTGYSLTLAEGRGGWYWLMFAWLAFCAVLGIVESFRRAADIRRRLE